MRIVFVWDLSPHWQIETDPERSSEVELTFAALDESTTRVVLEHRYLDRHGVGWEAARDAVAGGEGWPRYIDAYVTLISEGVDDGC